MFLTIQTLFDDANIVSAIIRRVNRTRKDTIYWQQYLTFRRVTTRVFKDYIGSVTGVMAGSINHVLAKSPSVNVGTLVPDMVRLPTWAMLIRCPSTDFPSCRI